MALILRYSPNSEAFAAHCVKVVEDIPKLSDRNVAQST